MAISFTRTCITVSRSRLLTPVVAAVFGAFLFSSGLASTKASIDQSFMLVEQVDGRLSSTSKLVETVSAAAQADGVNKVDVLTPILKKAASSAFDHAAMKDKISAALAKASGTTVTGAEFAQAAQDLANMFITDASREPGGGSDLQNPERISKLVDIMASPDLASETALTAQVMYSALELLTNASTDQLHALSRDDLQQQLLGLVKTLRAKHSNEKPVPKDIASAQEKNRLSVMLKNLPEQDLSVLEDFYNSDTGKAKSEALIDAYREVSDAANAEMLNLYMQDVLTQLKTNSSLKQN